LKRIKFLLGSFCLSLMVCAVNVNALTVTENYTLTEDLTETVIVSGSNVTINLNNHNIKVAANGALRVDNGANVTVTGEGTIESTNNNGVVVSNGSTFTLKSGNIKSVEFGVLVANDSTFTMDGGVITTSDNCGVGGNGSDTNDYKNYTININGGTINGNIQSSGYVSCGIYHPNKGTVNFNGGTINSSNGAGIVQRAGTLNITGGTINTAGSSTGRVGDSRVVVTASAIVVDKEANYPEVATLKTTISNDAVLNGAAGSIETIGEGINIELTGGLYTEEPAEEQIKEGYSAYKVLAGENEDMYVVVEDSALENTVSDGMVSEADLNAADVNLIKEAIEGKYDLISFYEVSLLTVTPAGDIVDFVEEASEKVNVTLGLPQELPSLKNGFSRKYYVIRVHNGEVTIIKDVTVNSDNTISFKSDKFSTYAIAYEDTKNETTSKETTSKETTSTANPKTGDNIILNFVIFILSLTGLTIELIYFNKRRVN